MIIKSDNNWLCNPEIIKCADVLWLYQTGCQNNLDVEQFDVIICLGSYDTTVAKFAAHRYLAGGVGSLLFTGSEGNWTHGLYSSSEAAHFAGIAVKIGVPWEQIILEEGATNIGQNIEFSEKLLEPLDNITALYITKPQTQRRLLLTLQEKSHLQHYKVMAVKRCLSEAFNLFGEKQIINEMVGDIDRILKYPKKGFLKSTQVPKKVFDAYEQLKFFGYRSHLL